MQSIRKRLVSNYVAIALFTVLLLECIFTIVISQYYLGGVERTLVNHTETAANFLIGMQMPEIFTQNPIIFLKIWMWKKMPWLKCWI